MNRINLDFDKTFRALEAGLHVEHIAAFKLRTCRPTATVASVLNDPRLESYDQIPVRNGIGIIGVLERTCLMDDADVREASVVKVMQPLDSSMLVATSHPIGTLIDRFGSRPYRLVVKGNDIKGIVTPSDFLKLPVRLYAFTLITHLEMRTAAHVRHEFEHSHDAWLLLLSQGRRDCVERKRSELKVKNHDPDLVELTDLCDKREILRKHWRLGQPFQRDLENIQELRNSVAHAGNYLTDNRSLEQLLESIRVTKHYIGQLGREMTPRLHREPSQQLTALPDVRM